MEHAALTVRESDPRSGVGPDERRVESRPPGRLNDVTRDRGRERPTGPEGARRGREADLGGAARDGHRAQRRTPRRPARFGRTRYESGARGDPDGVGPREGAIRADLTESRPAQRNDRDV